MYEALVKSSRIADTVGGTFSVHADDDTLSTQLASRLSTAGPSARDQ